MGTISLGVGVAKCAFAVCEVDGAAGWCGGGISSVMRSPCGAILGRNAIDLTI